MSQRHAVESHPQCMERIPGLSGMSGVCLTELLVGLAAGVIVLASAWETLTIVHHHVVKQQHDLAHQQDLRLGLEVFEQEVRLAAADSIVTAQPDEFLFLANINVQHTTTTSAVVQGQLVLAVQDGSGWGQGKTIAVCGPHACEQHRLARPGQRASLTLTEPIESAFPSGASIEVKNRVSYYIRHDEDGLLRLMRMVDGGASTLVAELRNARFAYRDNRGRTTTVPSHVRRVVVEIESSRFVQTVVREVGLRS